MGAFPPIDKDNLAMPILFPSHESLTLSIDNGIPEDYHLVRLYYGRYSGWFYRQRLQMVADLLKGENRDQLLEVGVGSGVFIPELLKYANQVTGIDIHEIYHGVQTMLMNERIDLGRVCLKKGSVLNIPFPDNSFDIVVCVSVLEHFVNPLPAIKELVRVMKPQGILALGFPTRNTITSALFGILGYHSHEIHPASHRVILQSIQQVLPIKQLTAFPGKALPLYL